MKHVRKLLAVLLTMVMTLVLALPMSFAADEETVSQENDLRVMVMSDMHTSTSTRRCSTSRKLSWMPSFSRYAFRNRTCCS